MKTRYQKTKTPETKFLNVYIKEEFSRESSISHDRFVKLIINVIMKTTDLLSKFII